MALINKALVIGGGIAGMSVAIQLRKLGSQVDLVEIDKNWRVYGAGITLSGPTLRAFKEIGIIDALARHGALTDGLELYTAQGHKIADVPTPRIAGPEVPGSGGIMRPVLATILREATLASGTAVRCGTTFASIEQSHSKVEVCTTDGRRETYDLVIGADGLQSAVRKKVFTDAPTPTYTGQGVWRAVAPRAPEVKRAAMFMGNPLKVGINPISQEQLYLFLTEPRNTPEFVNEGELIGTLRALLAGFGGPIAPIREGLGEHSCILYRPFWKLLLPAPWYSGRVLLIGDAVHATTPHLASGAGIGVEDAVVIAQEISKASSINDAMNGFMERRFERCRVVVESSVRLGDLERLGGSKEAHEQLTREAIATLLAPI
jgi:2-polyprenyl-6-methoxyphenol hydroxylase-like FAD-dependent oxidoreductase